MKHLLINFYKLMFFLIPLPLFIDFGVLELFIITADDYQSLKIRPIIPLPVGAFSFACSLLLGYICATLYPERFRSILPPSKLFLFYLFAVLPLCLYSIYIANLSLPRLIQILLPIVFLSLLSFPTQLSDRLSLFKCVFASAFTFFTFHFISIISNSENWLRVDDITEFSSFFGYQIYQSLVTYPAVLTLYLYLTIALIYVIRLEPSLKLKNMKAVAYIHIFVLLYLLATSGRRAFLVEYTSSLIVLLVLSIVYILSNRFVKKRTALYFSLFILLFISFFIFYINTPLSGRVVSSIKNDNFDSGRIDILGRALAFYSNNLDILFLGGGQRDTPGFHNFILDQIYRIGLVGTIAIYSNMLFLIKRFIKTTDYTHNHRSVRRLFIIMLFTSLFLQSMINASVSQPYYFVNFLTITILIYFVLFNRINSEVKI